VRSAFGSARRLKPGQKRLSPLDPVPRLNQNLGRDRKVHIRPGSKFDHAKAFAPFQYITRGPPGHNPPGDQSGNLAHDNVSIFGLQQPDHRFVFQSHVRVPGIQKLPSMVMNIHDLPCHRAPVDMDVQNGEKNADPLHRLIRKNQFFGFINTNHFPIRRRHGDVRLLRGSPARIPEKAQDQAQSENSDKKQRPPQPGSEEGEDSHDE